MVLNLAQCSVAKAGDTLTLTVSLAFKSPFLGQKKVYLRAVDDAGLASAWAQKGVVNVGAHE